MHLWPSLRLRDSFKRDYLSKIQRNLFLMKFSDSSSSSCSGSASASSPADSKGDCYGDDDGSTLPLLTHCQQQPKQVKLCQPATETKLASILSLCGDMLFLFSCCCCCNCCGACDEAIEK